MQKIVYLSLAVILITALKSYSQQGTVVINQDNFIQELLQLKKEINTTEIGSNAYTIQVYTGGSRSAAQSAKSTFDLNFNKWNSVLLYEEPDFKVWGGRYQTRLEADRALSSIKNNFPNAFILRPKKN